VLEKKKGTGRRGWVTGWGRNQRSPRPSIGEMKRSHGLTRMTLSRSAAADVERALANCVDLTAEEFKEGRNLVVIPSIFGEFGWYEIHPSFARKRASASSEEGQECFVARTAAGWEVNPRSKAFFQPHDFSHSTTDAATVRKGFIPFRERGGSPDSTGQRFSSGHCR